MRYLFALLFAALSLNAVGQVEYPYPYNPDSDSDGFIGINDLLDLLSIYAEEFSAGVLATDSISAIYYTGEMDYWDCASSCVGLRGNWKILDHHLVGSYKPELASQGSNIWLDFNNSPRASHGNYTYVPYIFTEIWEGRNTVPQVSEFTCFCQTRTRADIEDINLCEDLEDECSVCNGEGAVYECGCADMPEGDCDCDGNQIDAVGVCGGDCLEDLDGDGVCDPVLGPCEGQDFVSYNGYEYDIIETADERCWFAENLRTLMFSNGEEIQLSSQSNGIGWSSLAGSSGSVLNSQAGVRVIDSHSYIPLTDEESFVYNFSSVIDESGLCPTDWHIPSKLEFNNLFDSYGGSLNAALSLKAPEIDGCNSVIFNTSGLNIESRLWFESNTSNTLQASFNTSRLWTSTVYNPEELIYFVFAHFASINHCGTEGNVSVSTIPLNTGLSVRCIKD